MSGIIGYNFYGVNFIGEKEIKKPDSLTELANF